MKNAPVIRLLASCVSGLLLSLFSAQAQEISVVPWTSDPIAIAGQTRAENAVSHVKMLLAFVTDPSTDDETKASSLYAIATIHERGLFPWDLRTPLIRATEAIWTDSKRWDGLRELALLDFALIGFDRVIPTLTRLAKTYVLSEQDWKTPILAVYGLGLIDTPESTEELGQALDAHEDGSFLALSPGSATWVTDPMAPLILWLLVERSQIPYVRPDRGSRTANGSPFVGLYDDMAALAGNHKRALAIVNEYRSHHSLDPGLLLQIDTANAQFARDARSVCARLAFEASIWGVTLGVGYLMEAETIAAGRAALAQRLSMTNEEYLGSIENYYAVQRVTRTIVADRTVAAMKGKPIGTDMPVNDPNLTKSLAARQIADPESGGTGSWEPSSSDPWGGDGYSPGGGTITTTRTQVERPTTVVALPSPKTDLVSPKTIAAPVKNNPSVSPGPMNAVSPSVSGSLYPTAPEWVHPKENQQQEIEINLPSPYEIGVTERTGAAKNTVTSPPSPPKPPGGGPTPVRTVYLNGTRYDSYDGVTFREFGAVTNVTYVYDADRGEMNPIERSTDDGADFYLRHPSDQPKLEIAGYVRTFGFLVPESFETLQEMIDSGKIGMMRSEHWEETAGGSGIRNSYKVRPVMNPGEEDLSVYDGDLSTIEPERMIQDFVSVYLKSGVLDQARLETLLKRWELGNPRSVLRPYLRFAQFDPETYMRNTSYSYTEFIRGKNGAIVADSSDPNRFYVTIDRPRNGDLPGQAVSRTVVVQGGTIVEFATAVSSKKVHHKRLAADDLLPPDEVILGLVDWYKRIVDLPRLRSAYIPLIEFQLTDDARIYFLQYHITTKANPATFTMNGLWHWGEFKALAVRGATPPEGIEVTTYLFPNDEVLRRGDDGPLGLALPGSMGLYYLHETGEKTAFLEAAVRRVSVLFVGTGDLFRDFDGYMSSRSRVSSGHQGRSIFFKPGVSVIVDFPPSIVRQVRELAGLPNEWISYDDIPWDDPIRNVKIRLRVTSDGRTAYVKLLGRVE